MNDITFNCQVQSFILQKHGTDSSECEDAICFSRKRKRFAVADGATEAFDSKSWARLLTLCWIRSQTSLVSEETFRELIASLGAGLHSKWQNRSLRWYAEEQAQRGSFAAFLGLQFTYQDSGIQWCAIALGDCCLVQFRDSRAIHKFPLTTSTEFGFRPILVPSLSSLQNEATSHLMVTRGAAQYGDVFFLMSDAVAQWYLALLECNDPTAIRFGELLKNACSSDLDLLIDDARGSNTMRNDDVAAIRVEILPNSG